MTQVASQIDISKAQAIGGWMSDRELVWLATHAREHPFIVEFGSLHGRSTRALADHLPKFGKVWAVDPWSGDYFNEDGQSFGGKFTTFVYPYFRKNLKDHIDSGVVVPKRGYSYDFDLPFYVDMVFIDGDHRYETVLRDIRKAWKLLRPNGLLCGHDYEHPGWPGVKKAVDELVGKVQIEDTIWYTRKS
jgi:predicted O-methyltransferase YrrM